MDENLDLNNNLTPQEYFDLLKDKKNKITDKGLQDIYDNCLTLAHKYLTTGQIKGMKKLLFHIETISLEKEIVSMGVNTFVYKDVIENYIDNISNDVVKIIEIENYEREIPDEIVEVVKKTKDKFSQLYVLYTDYTGKDERRVEKERRDKDPILFGTFQDKKSETIIDRFYFLGDWQDEYCDLTLDKMVNQIKNKTNKDVVVNIKTPHTIDELKEQLKLLEIKDNKIIVNNPNNIKEYFISKVRTFFGL